jgi:hypothetical protein
MICHNSGHMSNYGMETTDLSFEVFTAVTAQMVFWAVILSSPVGGFRHFRGTCLHLQG